MKDATKKLKKAHRKHVRFGCTQSLKEFARDRARQLSPSADYKRESQAWLERKVSK